jgi:hypothetical protein
MSQRQFVLWCGLLIVLVFASLMSPEVHAQFAPPPDAYSVTETNAMFGPAATMEILRDGSKVLVDYQSHAATLPSGHSHLRTLYDLDAHRSFTWDLLNSAVPCGASSFSGDWGDPFAMSAALNADMSKQQAKPAGAATLNGIATKIFESQTPQGKTTAWLEEKYGLIVKLTMGPSAGQPQTMIEVKHFSAAKPPASVFVLPPVCGEAAKTPRAPTEAERIAADTGGSAGDYANVIYANAILGPASKNSCTAVLKVVRAGSMEPLTSGFQVAVDTTLDVEHPPHYTIGIGSNGQNTFSGGGLHEVTGQMRNGQLRIENVPSALQIELTFGKAGDASALIYRQCFAPQTTLLFVVKNPDKLSDGGHWLWVESGQ